ncbi:MAG TPA: sensor histidine kinase [Thermoanaerobacterales bacterium]|nr:sensor histidine kinase [Thermoanaerobacterales bacterium]
MDTNLKDKDEVGKEIDINLTASTWGTLLILFVLAVVSVSLYSPIRNMTIGYRPFTSDNFGDVLQQEIILILAIGALSVFLLTILTFAVPYSHQKKATMVQFFNKIYLEIKFLLWLMFFMVFIFGIGLIGSLELEKIIHEINWYFYTIGIPVTFIFYTLIYLSLINLKHIHYTGFVNEIIHNTLIGKLCVYVNKYVSNSVAQIIDVEITKKHKEKLLSLLLINFVVLILINLVGSGLGILLIIGYTVLLFNYGVELLEKVRALNAASRQLSTGNFDVTLPEDMGILSSFAKNLNNIKEGFKVAVEQEVKSQNMKTQLISNVSHDLKTPLTSIITYVDLLKKEDIDQETLREYIDILDRKSKRLQVLIDDLFEASKASTGDIELHLENLDVVALLRQTLGEMEEKINQSTLKIRVNLPDHKIICNLDGARTYRVFENILSNILKYSLQNTRVYIDAVEDEKNVSLIFKNISAYEMNFDPSEITERFMRADQSRNTEGSGLGLAISKSLVELQDGTIDIDIDGDLFKLTVTFPKI